MGWNLSSPDRERLQDQVRSSAEGRLVRRCSALLRLDRGERVAVVARDLGVSRQSVDNGRHRAIADGSGLSDRERGGRPSVWRPRFVRRLQRALEASPRDVGFQAASWTADLLQAHLQDALDFDVSTSSIRRKLPDLGYVWKRFRYTLQPDPEREKKKTHPQACQGVARTQRRAFRG